MRFSLKEGHLTLQAHDAAVRLHGLRPSLVYWVGGTRCAWRPLLQPAPGGATAVDPIRGLALELSFAAEGPALTVHLSLRNLGVSPIRIDSLAPLWMSPQGQCEIGASAADWGVWRNGYQSWTGTRSFRAHETDLDPWSNFLKIGLIDIRRPSYEEPGRFRSDFFAAITNLKSQDALVAGFLDGTQAFAEIDIGISGETCSTFSAQLDYDEIELAPGATLTTPPLWLATGTDPQALLDTYAEVSGRAMGARIPGRNPTGWCSWYYYFTRIDQKCIRENLQDIGKLRKRFPCDYFQIDDGYQSAIGDWLTPNAKFPDGMGALAREIQDAGMYAGIWTAPFIVRTNSRLFKEHPDWFVKSPQGGPRFALWNPLWGLGSCYALDTTHPEALAWLGETFRTIVHDWGYRILKLDFLYAAALPGLRYDRNATRAQALRRGLEEIRRAAGDDAFLLGCGCPLAPAVGVVDAMRIGPDVAPFWTRWLLRILARDQHGLATKHAIRNMLTRSFLHRRWWLNDPDCLMVREKYTQLTPDEIRTLATAIAVTDGMLIVSENMRVLPEASIETLKRAMALTGGRPSTPDLLAADPPSVVVSRSARQTVVAVFNFADTAQEMQTDLRAIGVDVPGARVREHWTGIEIPIQDGTAQLGSVPPHACRVLVWAHGKTN